jgi:hypothetical protein
MAGGGGVLLHDDHEVSRENTGRERIRRATKGACNTRWVLYIEYRISILNMDDIVPVPGTRRVVLQVWFR